MAMTNHIKRIRECRGKKQYKTEEEVVLVCTNMENEYKTAFTYYSHQDHFHVTHANPSEYSSVTGDKYCSACRRRYQSPSYEEHCERKPHQHVLKELARFEKMRAKVFNKK